MGTPNALARGKGSYYPLPNAFWFVLAGFLMVFGS